MNIESLMIWAHLGDYCELVLTLRAMCLSLGISVKVGADSSDLVIL